ncbi:MAG: GNAT family N-acetyltransferase [Streptomycetaceae bacterium]|nr:GNAT family N-acetyltransferase [Streptomycetaceae bacterium]
MSDYHIRAAGPADIDAVLAFWAVAAEGTSISDDRDGVARLIDRDPEALLIAAGPDGAIAGTVIAGWDGWRCHLYRLAVDPARRRQGVGRLLLDAAERRFAELGGRRGDAMVLDRNELGRAAWAASGYRPEPHWTRWTKPLAS